MRPLLAAIALAACGHPAAPAQPAAMPAALPRLLAPAPLDPSAKGAAYLTAIALQLQPGWGQFLDDCRLRLPASHPLNQTTLATTAELIIDRAGNVATGGVVGSGNADFDHAVGDAIADTGKLAAPPVELLSDDDRLHVRWLFARDRRQAGPATAEIVSVELPVAAVVDRLIAAHDLSRAARRIARAPDDAARQAATERLMVASLREAIGSNDGAARRAAIAAIGRARIKELAADVRALLVATSDTELRLVGADTAAAVGDTEAAPTLLAELPVDLPEHPRLALAEGRALVALGRAKEAAAAVREQLEAGANPPAASALRVLAVVPVPELDSRLTGWALRGDARTRAAACVALGGAAPAVAWPAIVRGLRDADATVRAACADTAGQTPRGTESHGDAVARLRELARDRDRAVRAHAVAALGVLDATHPIAARDDQAAEVRAAFAAALAGATSAEAEADLRVLIDDRDPDVRAAAWGALSHDGPTGTPAGRAQLALRAIADAAAPVRLAAVVAVDDDDALARLSAADDSPDVRTAALVQLAGRRGRTAAAPLLLDRLAAASLASADRVRIALAWLLAR